MFLRPLLLCAVFCALFVHSACAEQRIFTDTSGRLLRGELVSVAGDMVTIKRSDGEVFTVKATMFCNSDIDYFKSHGLQTAAPTPAPGSSTPNSNAFPVDENAANAKLPELKSRNQQGLGAQMEMSNHIGPEWGDHYSEIPAERVLLVGFELGEATGKDGYNVFHALRPIWLTPTGPQLGATHGKGRVEKTVRVLAKPGYAVGDVAARAGVALRGMTVVFMKIKGETLDPSDSYKSDLYGAAVENSKTLTSEGHPIVGIYGNAGDDVNRLGFVYERSASPAISTTTPSPSSAPSRGGIRGKFYIAIDDAVNIYINGVAAVKVDSAQTTESTEVELKAGDRIVAQLINRGGPRFLMLLFVSSDRQSSISFLHTNFKILRDPDAKDFAAADLQALNQYAKQITNKHQKPLPYKCHSEFIWGDADLAAIGTVITPDMIKPLPQ